MKWTRDGDQHVARGVLGEYRITRIILRTGECFSVRLHKASGARRGIGDFSSLANAKNAAETYENYRAVS